MSASTPYFRLNSLAGWRAGSLNGLTVQNGEALSLARLPGSGRPLIDAEGTFGGFQSAIGVAVDSQDRVCILDEQSCLVKRFDRCQRKFVRLPCIGGEGSQPRQLRSPHGLAISRTDNLYIADTGNRRVQIFSLKGLALRWIWGPLEIIETADGITAEQISLNVPAPHPDEECGPRAEFPRGTWEPWDIAVACNCWAYVSDYANGLIHVFDAQGCWRTAYTGAGPNSPHLVQPTRLALDRAGRIYVIQENQNEVVVLEPNGDFAGKIQQPDELKGRFCPVAVAIDLHGNVCVSDCLSRQVYFYQPVGNGTWCAFRCCGCIDAFAESILFDAAGHAIYADGAQRACVLDSPFYLPGGTYFSEALDSKTFQCVWHRVALRGCIPPGTAVQVDTVTAESPKGIDEIVNLPESRWTTGQADTGIARCDWDCLIQSPPGRYLWLRLKFSGDGADTPVIGEIKVQYPRASSIRYLPAIYQENPGADFLDRFLSIFDTIREKTSHQITDLARYFDPRATPAIARHGGGTDFLSWLASWLGMALQNNWPVERRRDLVRCAHRLYAMRGTPEGLRLHIQLYSGVSPRIVELFRLRRWLLVNQSKLGDCSVLFADGIMKRLQVGVNSKIGSFRLIDLGDPALDLFNAHANQFLVLVPRWPGAGDGEEQTLRQIIELSKPAHTIAQLQWAEARFRIGTQSLVGVDTVIAKYPVGIIEGRGKLGYDTVVGDPGGRTCGPAMRVSERSIIGCTTMLN